MPARFKMHRPLRRPPVGYSLVEFSDMLTCYNDSNCNMIETRKLYKQRFPDRRTPHASTILTALAEHKELEESHYAHSQPNAYDSVSRSEEKSENENHHDGVFKKLLMKPIVYTTRLDDMNVFNLNLTNRNVLDVTARILVESKPKLQHRHVLVKSTSTANRLVQYLRIIGKLEELSQNVQKPITDDVELVKTETELKVTKSLSFSNLQPLQNILNDPAMTTDDDNTYLKPTAILIHDTLFEDEVCLLESKKQKVKEKQDQSRVNEKTKIQATKEKVVDSVQNKSYQKDLLAHKLHVKIEDCKSSEVEFYSIYRDYENYNYFRIKSTDKKGLRICNTEVSCATKSTLTTISTCCWYERENKLASLKYEYSTDKLRFLRRSHTCPKDKCACCCRPKNIFSDETPPLPQFDLLGKSEPPITVIQKALKYSVPIESNIPTQKNNLIKRTSKTLSDKIIYIRNYMHGNINEYRIGPNGELLSYYTLKMSEMNNSTLVDDDKQVITKTICCKTKGDHLIFELKTLNASQAILKLIRRNILASAPILSCNMCAYRQMDEIIDNKVVQQNLAMSSDAFHERRVQKVWVKDIYLNQNETSTGSAGHVKKPVNTTKQSGNILEGLLTSNEPHIKEYSSVPNVYQSTCVDKLESNTTPTLTNNIFDTNLVKDTKNRMLSRSIASPFVNSNTTGMILSSYGLLDMPCSTQKKASNVSLQVASDTVAIANKLPNTNEGGYILRKALDTTKPLSNYLKRKRLHDRDIETKKAKTVNETILQAKSVNETNSLFTLSEQNNLYNIPMLVPIKANSNPVCVPQFLVFDAANNNASSTSNTPTTVPFTANTSNTYLLSRNHIDNVDAVFSTPGPSNTTLLLSTTNSNVTLSHSHIIGFAIDQLIVPGASSASNTSTYFVNIPQTPHAQPSVKNRSFRNLDAFEEENSHTTNVNPVKEENVDSSTANYTIFVHDPQLPHAQPSVIDRSYRNLHAFEEENSNIININRIKEENVGISTASSTIFTHTQPSVIDRSVRNLDAFKENNCDIADVNLIKVENVGIYSKENDSRKIIRTLQFEDDFLVKEEDMNDIDVFSKLSHTEQVDVNGDCILGV